MLLQELLKGLDATKPYSVEEIVKLVNANALELKAKVLIDDGKEDVFVPKARLDDEIGKKKTIQATLDATNKDLEDIRKSAGDNKSLTDKIDALQKTNSDLDVKLKAQTLDTAIKLKAMGLNAKDKTGADVLAFIDKAKLKLNDDGTVTGLDEAIKTITESKPYLFDGDSGGGTGNPGQGGKGGGQSQGIVGIGKMLAEQSAQGVSVDIQTARDSYFK